MKTYKQFMTEVFRAITLGPSRSPVGRQRQQKNASERAAFRRAGVARSRPGARARFNAVRSNSNSTTITTYPNQTSYAQEFMPSKVDDKTNKVVSTKKRALYLKRLVRQTGNRSSRKVHAVDVLPTHDSKKNDPGFMTRGREYDRDVKNIPNAVKTSGGTPGDIIAGKAAEVIPGSKNFQRGRAARESKYSKVLGATKRDPITNIQTAKIKG